MDENTSKGEESILAYFCIPSKEETSLPEENSLLLYTKPLSKDDAILGKHFHLSTLVCELITLFTYSDCLTIKLNYVPYLLKI